MVLLIFFIINNVESGQFLGAVALIGCKAALASCLIGTSGVGLHILHVGL